jgi:hypothetical protein
MEGYLNENFIGYKKINAFFYIDLNSGKIKINFENVKKINVILYQISLDKEYNIQNKSDIIVNDNFITLDFDFIDCEKKICNVLFFNCLETVDNENTFKILSFN